MKKTIAFILLCLFVINLTGCEQQPANSDTPTTSASTSTEPAPAASSVEIPEYSAEAFFETTSYGLPGSAGHTFSTDGKALLMSSDATGVFNVYSLPLDGSRPKQLTQSSDNAVFAVSWFPGDNRILYTYDGGGDELNHVFVRKTDGSTQDLTPGDELKAAFLAWAKDGQSFYLATTERDGKSFDIYRYSASDYSRE